MKIATWNIERLKHKSKLEKINSLLEKLSADILVLTETDSRVFLPQFKNCIQTNKLAEIDDKYYLATENRVSIYTNYEIVKQLETFDKYTSLCVELKTEKGNLIILGTIVGIYGNRNENFKKDLLQQVKDINKLSKGNNFCLIGDYNTTFSDNYYFTNFGREELNRAFDKNNLQLITRNKTECIDHIAISKNFIANYQIETEEWNEDKMLSDHKGIMTILTKKNGE
jgi:endonuclease/exonuclease/phosphatase family metal-dependent hydrolase